MNLYSGTIVNVNELKKYQYIVDLVEDKNNKYAMQLYNLFHEMVKYQSNQRKKQLDDIFVNLFRPNPINETGKSIIFQKVTDKDGNIYGKELITGLIFPIENKYTSVEVNYYRNKVKNVFLDKKSGKVYSFKDKSPLKTFYIIEEQLSLELSIPYSESKKLLDTKVGDEINVTINNEPIKLTNVIPSSIIVEIKPKMMFSDKVVNQTITKVTPVSDFDINTYIEPFIGLFGKKKRKKEFYDSIYELYSKNELGDITYNEEEIEGPIKIKKI